MPSWSLWCSIVWVFLQTMYLDRYCVFTYHFVCVCLFLRTGQSIVDIFDLLTLLDCFTWAGITLRLLWNPKNMTQQFNIYCDWNKYMKWPRAFSLTSILTSVCLSVHRPSTCLFVSMFVCPSLHLSVPLSSIRPSVFPSVCLSIV
jgi:hypothetical protein